MIQFDLCRVESVVLCSGCNALQWRDGRDCNSSFYCSCGEGGKDRYEGVKEMEGQSAEIEVGYLGLKEMEVPADRLENRKSTSFEGNNPRLWQNLNHFLEAEVSLQ